MPTFAEDTFVPETSPTVDQGVVSGTQLKAAMNQLNVANHEFSTAETIGLGLPSAAVDLVDSVGSSLSATVGLMTPGQNPGWERGDLNQSLLNAIGSPYLNQFNAQNKDGIEIVSGVAGLVGSIWAGGAAVKGAEVLGATRGASWFSKALTLDARYKAALDSVRLAELESAGLGVIGEATFLARADAAKDAMRLATLSGLRTGVAQEAVLAATMNQNDFLFSDSVGTNVAWALLGAGVNTWVERVVAKSAIRKIGSDQVVTRRFVDAFDPTGGESKRLGFWKSAGGEVQTTSAGAFDDVTALLVERESLRSGEGALDPAQRETLIRNRESMATQLLARAKEKVAIGVGRGLPHDGQTRIQFGAKATTNSDAANHVEFVLSQDPTAFVNLRYLGAIPEGQSVAHVAESYTARSIERESELLEESLNPKLNFEQQSRIQKQLAELNRAKNATLVSFVDGERLPLAEGAIRAEYLSLESPILKAGDNIFTAHTSGRKGALASIDSELKLTLGGKKSLAKLDLYDVKRLYELGEFTAKQLVRSRTPITLNANPTWFELDLAERILGLSKDPGKVVFPQGMTRETAQVESFAQKIEAIQAQAKSISKIGDPDQLKLRNRIIFNLPRQTSAQMGLSQSGDSLPEIVAYALKHGDADKIRQMSLAEVHEVMNGYRQIGGFTPNKNIRFDSLMGNSFTLGRDANGNKLAPLVGVMDPIRPHQWSHEHLAYRIGANRAGVMGALTGDSADEFTKILTNTIIKSPESETAFAINTLRDTQLTRSGTGKLSAFASRASNKLLTPEFIARDAAPVAAMTRLRDTVSRLNNSMTAKIFSDSLGDVVARLANPRNRESSLLLDSFFSFARGWDLKPPVNNADFWEFHLADTAANREKYLSMTGREMPENAQLLSPNGTPIALDDLAMDALNRFNRLSETRRNAVNTILRAKGLKEVAEKSYYVPSPVTRGKFVAFTFDPQGNMVVGKSIIANSQIDYAKKLAVVESELEKLGPGYRVRRLEDIQEFGSVWDRAALEFEDSGHATSMGQKNRGGLIQHEVEIGAFRNALEDMRNRFYRHTDDIISAGFEDAIAGVKSRIVAANESRPVTAKSLTSSVAPGVYQRWLDAAMGNLRIHSSDSLHAKVSGGLEGYIDEFLSGTHDASRKISASKTYQALDAWWSRANPLSSSAAAKKDFAALSRSLGEFMPIESHADWLRAEGYGNSPWTTRDIVNKLSGFTSAITLRIFDAATSVMTMGSMVANMPSVMRQLDRMTGESLAEWQLRTRNFGIVTHLGNNEGIGILDMTKIVSNGIKAVFDPEFAPVLKDMAARGMTTQEIAELTKHMAILTPRGSVAKTFLGDPSITNPRTVAERVKAKGLVGSASILTDSAENYSRMFSSTVGYKLAESIGIEDHAARMSFAHNFANNVIADYNPLNRPEAFQGPFGAAAGLFKTFIQNYYQRLFGYVETKNWRPLLNQYVAQGGLFGIPSVPGWSALDVFSQRVGEDGNNATDRVANNSGALHDLVMGGALANLPKLFGAPATSIYTRGDTNLRIPNPTNLADIMPAASVILRMTQGLVEAASLAKPDGIPVTTQRLGEVISNMVVNRSMAGLTEVALAGGYDTDRYGQTVSVAQTNAEKIYRVLGLKSLAQEESVRAYYRSKPYLEQQAAIQSKLRKSVRAAVREGRLDDLLPQFQREHLETGGDPSYFRRFINDATKSAEATISERALKRALNNPSRGADVERYLGAGVELSRDEAERKEALELLNSMDGVDQPYELNDPSALATPGVLDPELSLGS